MQVAPSPMGTLLLSIKKILYTVRKSKQGMTDEVEIQTQFTIANEYVFISFFKIIDS
jgi:hypothetical protein